MKEERRPREPYPHIANCIQCLSIPPTDALTGRDQSAERIEGDQLRLGGDLVDAHGHDLLFDDGLPRSICISGSAVGPGQRSDISADAVPPSVDCGFPRRSDTLDTRVNE